MEVVSAINFPTSLDIDFVIDARRFIVYQKWCNIEEIGSVACGALT